MKRTAATALILLLLFFLIPFLFLRGDPLASLGGGASPTATPEPTPVPSGPLDSERQIRVRMEDGTVEIMSMGDYLWGVVAAEMPASFQPEALKAQTVAARTYALRKMSHTTQAHPEADVCTDHTCCQAYIAPEQAAANWGGDAAGYTNKIEAAVAQTDGMAALYDGQLIDAVFFSSAAGKTVDAVEVWGSSVPYLTGVDSPEGDEVPNYRSTVELSADDFKAKFLEAYPQADLSGAPSGWFGAPQRSSSGTVSSMTVGGVTVRGTELRSLFGLRSASFTVSVEGETIVFSVTGYGHGVGMSQYGANALAKEGRTYEEILKWYYTGIQVEPYPG